ncbi:MAG: adenosylcobalamin-dependent ribonucleoside-diphosphate reductase [Ignisphaera sp.]|uniref:Vitamin B12-dependent ribonucleotide reductase n=1 Tax=Ignisphaera aggregans TaxID=334771 RepID=A0A832CZD6_9CREN
MTLKDSEIQSVATLSQMTVIKRNGSAEPFDANKLINSLVKACQDLCTSTEVLEIVKQFLNEVGKQQLTSIPSNEIAERIVRMMVANSIFDPKWLEVAKRYELGKVYKDVYRSKEFILDPRDLRLSFISIKVLKNRYLLRDPETRRFIETPQMMFKRVAKAIAALEYRYCMDNIGDISKCNEVIKYWEDKFYELIADLRFLPNSPTIMNAGTKLGILSACFVIPVRDSIVTYDGEGIYDALRAQAIIFQQGGGTGFDFSELRPEGDAISTTSGSSSGPLSFMKMFDVNTDIIKQGGRRRGANMGIMHVWHPDIEKFIDAKAGGLKDVNLQNFNISVGAYDYFMYAAINGGMVPLVNPRKTNLRPDLGNDSRYYAIVKARNYITDEWIQTEIVKELEARGGSTWLDESIIVTVDEAMAIAEDMNAIVSYIDAKKLFEKMARNAWDSGDPGLIFIDTINRRHTVWYLGKINATNPCGEQPLLPWESCNLGSINLEKYVYVDDEGNSQIDWEKMAYDLKVICRFMDNVIDAASWPLKQLEEAAKKTRKIGLGVMGWHHMLIKLGIPYDSVDALYLAYYLAEWIAYNAALASIELAKERKPFALYDPEKYRPTWLTAKSLEELLDIAKLKDKPSNRVLKLIEKRPPVNWHYVEELRIKYGIRNATLTSVAPTGSISIIACTSPGIEPIFAVAFERHTMIGTFIEINRVFLEYLKKYELEDPKLIKIVAEKGSVADLYFIPKSLRILFKTAYDIEHRYHVLHQAVWQQWVCGGVSKTVNLRFEASIDDVKEIYTLAWMLGCKGITIYRDKSKRQQVIYVGIKMPQKEETSEVYVEYHTKYRSLDEAIESLTKVECQQCEY